MTDIEKLKQFGLMEFLRGENLDAVASQYDSLTHEEIEDVIRDEIRALGNNNQQALQWVADRDVELTALREAANEVCEVFRYVEQPEPRYSALKRLMELTKRNES